jgi:hypothetical protein
MPSRTVTPFRSTYGAIVCQLANACEVLTDADYTEARALELLGGKVPVTPRADGNAALALNLNLEPITKACGSTSSSLVARAYLVIFVHFHNGSG